VAQLPLRLLGPLVAGAVTAGGLAPAAPTEQAAVPSDSSLFAARAALWRDYFANAPDLAAALPENFVAINEGDSVWTGRAATLAEAKASAARGTRLTALSFPENTVQRYGSVAIIHSRYDAVLERGADHRRLRGLITEIFVWNGRRWIHPSWHMNVESPGGPW
jgi:hypothetical protein